MSDKYAALKQAAAEATQGSWYADYAFDVCHESGAFIVETHGDNLVHNAKFIAAANPATILELLGERDADKRRIDELTEALSHSVAGYKSCLRMGYDRIIDLGGDCDAPEVMIAGNPDIQQAEKLLSVGISLKIEGE